MHPSTPLRFAPIAATIVVLALGLGCAGPAPPSDDGGAGDIVRAQFERHPPAYRVTINGDVVAHIAYPSG